MANNKVKHYRTDVAGRKPDASKMLEGEIAINMTDKSIFTKRGTEIVNIGNGADSVVEGGQTFIGDVQANKLKSDTDISLKNSEKSSIVFEDEHGKAKVELKSEKQTDSEGSLKVVVSNGKNASTGYSTYDFVNGRLRLPVAPIEADNATRKDYVDSEIKKVSDATGTNLTALENKVNANDTKQTEANTELDNRLNAKIDLNNTTINTKVDANKADADSKIKAVNDRLTVDNQTLTDMINTKVSKAGDTMTGDLTVPKLNADGIKANYINLGPNPNSLGANSIMMGDSDTGFKWREDGWLDTYSNNVVVSSVAGSQNFFNRQVTIRYRSDGAGNVNGLAPAGTSLLKIDTTTDGNGIGDGYTYFGLSNAGKYHNYLRGTGATFIDSVDGLRVSGQTHPLAGIVTSGKSVGTYDIYSMVNWSQDTQAFNRLRNFRATGAAAWFHELVWAHHDNPKYAQALTWWHGTGADNWIASLNETGNFKTNRFEAHGGGPAYKLISATAGSSYISGQNDGKENSWLLGKTDANTDILFQNNMVTGQSSAVILKQNHLQLNANGINTMAVLDNRVEISGVQWAATNSHAWADQWKQPPPVLLDFGSIPGESDYYPGYAMQNTSTQHGYHTRFEMGIIRAGAQYGKGVIRVSEPNHAAMAGKNQSIYEFDINGRFASPNIVDTPKVETRQITSFGVNTLNVLGGNSIAFGDGDTGIRQRTDGNLEILANSVHVATFDHAGINSLTTMRVSSPNDSRGVYVHNIRTGSANALIVGQVDGWADWGAWRERPAGMIVEAGSTDKCINIWKSVQWGTEWSAGMDIYNPAGGAYEAMLHVRGANFTFRSVDGAAHAVSWVSTSDKRLKSNLEKIENAVDKVNTLTGYVYDKKSDLKETEYSFVTREAGIIAQELKEVLPEAVSSFGEDEILGVNSAAVNALLVNAIKELSADLKETKARLDALELAK
ncbi:tail fiber domain-containing protein [Escherichia coli]